MEFASMYVFSKPRIVLNYLWQYHLNVMTNDKNQVGSGEYDGLVGCSL